MASPTTTFAPTATPAPSYGPTEAEDDDTFNVYTAITSLKWNDIWTVLLTSLVVAFCLLLFALSKMRKRSPFHLVYAPRYRWEREIQRKAARRGKTYEPLRRPKRTAAPWRWAWLALTISDAELLKHVGLEMYVMLRFIRMCLRISVFGTLVVLPVGASAYATADASGDTSDYSRVAWFRFTTANLEKHNTGRIWCAAGLMYVVTIQAVAVVALECFAFVELKQNFFTTPPEAADPVVAEQQMRSVMFERLPPELRTSERLREFWDTLLPGKVHSAVVCSDTTALAKLNRVRETVALKLERALLFRQRSGQEPLIRDDSCCGLPFPAPLARLRGCWCCSDDPDEDWEARRRSQGKSAIEYYQSRLAKLNAEFHVARSALVEATRRASANLPTSSSSVSEWTSVATGEAHAGTVFERLAKAFGVERPKAIVVGDRDSLSLESVASFAQQMLRAPGGQSEHCDCGFVTFADYTSAAMLRQMQLAPRPLSMECPHEGIPDAQNLIWANVPESLDASVARSNVASFLVYVLAFYWSLFISVCYVIASYKTLKRWGLVPRLGSLTTSQQTLLRYFFSVAPAALISAGLALLPILLMLMAEHYERMKLRSEIQLSVLQRNFFLQMINLWLTVVAGSVWDALKNIINKPTQLFRFLGKTLPTVSVYFVEIVVIKTFVSNFWEFSRVLPWLRLRAAKLAAGGALTARDLRDSVFLQPEMMYGSAYTAHLLVLIVLFLFAVIAPFAYPFCVAYFFVAYVVYAHNALHVYVPKYDQGGGLFFFPVVAYLLGALAATQLTLVGYLAVLQAWSAASFVLALPVLTYAFSRHVQVHYTPACEKAAAQLTLARDARYAAKPDDPATPLAPIDTLLADFDPFHYRQPDLADEDAAPHDLPSSVTPMDDANEDADFDDLGDAENVLVSAHGSALNDPLVRPSLPALPAAGAAAGAAATGPGGRSPRGNSYSTFSPAFSSSSATASSGSSNL